MDYFFVGDLIEFMEGKGGPEDLVFTWTLKSFDLTCFPKQIVLQDFPGILCKLYLYISEGLTQVFYKYPSDK